ncbi:MAG: hypothetical protein IEMM0006_0505 [bacterium]|nr:MAG: hypothetical protein IEMM0006_0505 [bacterium]
MNEKETAKKFRIVRHYFEEICTPLQTDCVAKLITGANPSKWHLAHATWLFETFVLQVFLRNYRPFHPHYGYLFNSYYNHVDHERKGETALCK